MEAEKQQAIAKLEGQKRQSQRAIEKEEITSREFPEGWNTTSTKGPPASQRGGEGEGDGDIDDITYSKKDIKSKTEEEATRQAEKEARNIVYN